MTQVFINATLVLADRLLPGGWLLEENGQNISLSLSLSLLISLSYLKFNHIIA